MMLSLTASHLVQEYKANQEILESQVRKLSQECAARDEEISKVGEKYALVMKQNVILETEIESLKARLSKQQQKIEIQESLLEKAEKVLKQKVSEISGLQAQKDALARKYGKVTRKVARLKAVVVSFNKTVSEFRKEREQLLNRVPGPQGTRESEQDSCEVYSANDGRDEKLPHSSKPESRPQSDCSESSSELVQFEREISPEPGGWHSGISPEALHYISASWTGDGATSHCEEGEVRGLRKRAPDSPFHDRSVISENQRYCRGTEKLILKGCESRDSSDEDEDDDEVRQSGLSSSSESQYDTSEHQFGRGERFENGRHLCQADIFHKEVKSDWKGRSSCGNVNVSSQKFKETTQTSGRTDSAEGLLLVKHDMENYALRATDRYII
ncbi:hypothetical protein HOLleu_08512 [Holothuria leucospilota]|uniref:Uncharacterized protein n=1 Tax=Holothuria leucospilota TaxID=206669 RepID=A0A9Q1HDJ0_HOLLE|nr:hypothetical protein HOLleu_08512 [Holothuria leucospilota]